MILSIVDYLFGDNAKAHFTDFIASLNGVPPLVVRVNGGGNSGHIIQVGDRITRTNHIPSGIHRKGSICALGPGMLVDLPRLLEEFQRVNKEIDFSINCLRIDLCAHIVLPVHKQLDAYMESLLNGSAKIGTTKSGIGPAYADKMYRTGIRISEIRNEESFLKKLKKILEFYYETYHDISNGMILPGGKEDIEKIVEEYKVAAKFFSECVCDVSLLVQEAIKVERNVILESAQGTLLDINHGTYPYVTASSCTSGGALESVGLSPFKLDKVLLATKAFATRVGGGPFITKLTEQELGVAEILHGQSGAPDEEKGKTTGRDRGIGWFDVVALNYSYSINGCTHLAIAKLDVIGLLRSIKICVAYEKRGVQHRYLPRGEDLSIYNPVYVEVKTGWGDLSNVKCVEDLPDSVFEYLRIIRRYLDFDPEMIISIGPKREQIFQI